MSNWQPIETAPKDGTQFIVCWDDVHDDPYMRVMSWEGTEKSGEFINVDGEGDYLIPAFWIRLPELPTLLPNRDGVTLT